MYRSVRGEANTERVIEKSRFLTYVSHAKGGEEARAFLSRVRGEHPLATHVCWAYVADKIGNEQRFSDDGEPQGTAGMPILGVIKAQKLFETAVAVVRYFGGIKLGAGGLTRAYAGCASEGLSAAKICEYDGCVELKITVNYPETDSLVRFLEGRALLGREFSAQASFTVAVREREKEGFVRELLDRLSGRAKIEEIKRYDYPFSID